MKPTLQLRLGQNLTLTPQLRQAIRLLQLSSVELEAEITAALESNPLLERPEDAEFDNPGSSSGEAAEENYQAESTESGGSEDSGEPDSDETRYEDLAPDWELDRAGTGSGSSNGSDDEDRPEIGSAVTEDLHDHLFWQLNLTPMSERDRRIAVALIDAIDDDGYLRDDSQALIESLLPEIQANEAEIEAVRHRLQHFDPIGVGSRTLSECLCVQLHAMPADTPGRELALKIAEQSLEALARQGADKLAHSLGVDPASVAAALELLRSCDPKPGAQISSTEVEYVVPDAFAFRQAGQWQVRLGPGSAPRLGVNRHYQGLIATAGKGDASYLRGQLQEAKWLIRSLETRAETLIKVARCIVKHQSGFLDRGAEAMRPLVLREVADEVGLHESTVSRVTTRKYLHTPRGTFEFKHFFSSSLSTSDGGTASSTAIQAMIKRLIDAENPRQPLSDSRLADELKTAGITVARRTVAKYREAMNIPSSNERQRVG